MNILLIFPGFIIAFIIVLYYERKIRRTKPKNKVHYYVARDKNGELWLYMGNPYRLDTEFNSRLDKGIVALTRNLKRFGLNKDDYDKLRWEDEPVEVFINMED